MRRSRANTSRNGPGLLRTTARTAVIAGTATATSHKVSSAMTASAQKRAAQQQQAAAAQPAMAAPEPLVEFVEPEPMAIERERIALLQQLAELKQQGILTEEEFASEKARILAA